MTVARTFGDLFNQNMAENTKFTSLLSDFALSHGFFTRNSVLCGKLCGFPVHVRFSGFPQAMKNAKSRLKWDNQEISDQTPVVFGPDSSRYSPSERRKSYPQARRTQEKFIHTIHKLSTVSRRFIHSHGGKTARKDPIPLLGAEWGGKREGNYRIYSSRLAGRCAISSAFA